MKKQNMKIGILLSFTGLIFSSSIALAMNTDDILGVWDNQGKDAKIEIYKCRGKFCGKIIELKQPNYLPHAKNGIPGTPLLDHNNHNPEMRKTGLIGLEIVHDFVYTGDDTWTDGNVYDPKNGKIYSGKLTLVSKNQLKLRGYIGIPLFGRTDVWTR